ncbi:MAG TPA: ThiF family adenylyltransferase [Candidatus Polarisedimenticolia bacterium]|nr:ThiF family adenylyltransferase [Candidatus Polarisedimenticolia bacterium]
MPHGERYDRQALFRGLGPEGQERLGAAAALIVGCGALGSHVADLLARAGVGRIVLVDRDFVERTNLHRQTLYDERDVADGLPKAVAAARHLGAVNPLVALEPRPVHLDAGNIEAVAAGVGVILDGTDNFETRFLVNDYALKRGVPWVYAACVGAYGLSMTIVPKLTPCLRCLLRSAPPPGSTETCDTAGIIAPIASLVAAVEAAEAIKILSGAAEAISRDLVTVDLWDNLTQRMRMDRASISAGCPACDQGTYEYLEGDRGARAVTLCGRHAVQVHPGPGTRLDLERLEERLRPLGPVVRNPYLLRLEYEGLALAVFADGRAIVSGTADPARARALYDRVVGT